MKYEVTDIQGEKEVFEGTHVSFDYDRMSLYDGDGLVILMRSSMVDRIRRVE